MIGGNELNILLWLQKSVPQFGCPGQKCLNLTLNNGMSAGTHWPTELLFCKHKSNQSVSEQPSFHLMHKQKINLQHQFLDPNCQSRGNFTLSSQLSSQLDLQLPSFNDTLTDWHLNRTLTYLRYFMSMQVYIFDRGGLCKINSLREPLICKFLSHPFTLDFWVSCTQEVTDKEAYWHTLSLALSYRISQWEGPLLTHLFLLSCLSSANQLGCPGSSVPSNHSW